MTTFADDLDDLLGEPAAAPVAQPVAAPSATPAARKRKAAPAPAPRPVGRPALPDDDPVKRARARSYEASAHLAELKAATVEGSLVEAAAVEREWTGRLRDLRARLLAIPSRVGARAPHLLPSDLAAVTAELHAALADFGGDHGPR